MSIDRRNGKWIARWRDPDGRQRSKTFTKKSDAAAFLARDPLLRSARDCDVSLAAALNGAGLDPAGPYIYLLWARQGDPRPLYVGSSTNVLARLGQHLGRKDKRAEIGWVSLIRCASEEAMRNDEDALILRLLPPWNETVNLRRTRLTRQGGN